MFLARNLARALARPLARPLCRPLTGTPATGRYASLTIEGNSPGNSITFTARNKGAAGNLISIGIHGNSFDSVVVTGSSIIVYFVADPSAYFINIADQINASTEAMALISVSVVGNDSVNGFANTYLTGGS